MLTSNQKCFLEISNKRGYISIKKQHAFSWDMRNTENVICKIDSILRKYDRLHMCIDINALQYFKHFIRPFNSVRIKGISYIEDLERIIDYVLPYHIRIDTIHLSPESIIFEPKFLSSDTCQTFIQLAKNKGINLNMNYS